MKQSLQLKLGQHLTMTPQLQQAIRLLQLSATELSVEVQEALDSNMMLELDDGDASPEDNFELSRSLASGNESHEAAGDEQAPSEFDDDGAGAVNNESIPEDLPIDTQWDDVYDGLAPTGSSSSDVEYDRFRSASESLQDHLLWQLNLLHLSETDQAIAVAIIDALTPDGYVECSLDDLRAALGEELAANVEDDEIVAVLKLVQAFEPAGVAARNLSECLQLQLRQLPESTPWLAEARVLCAEYLESLGNRDYNHLMRRMKLSQDDLLAIIHLIQSLNPRPGAEYSDDQAEYVVPDVFVRKYKGTWRVELNADAVPQLRVNPHYARMIRRADSSPDNTSLKAHLQEARWFIKSLQSRSETLLKVATAIVERQQAFLEHGEEAMKPLVLHDIAEILEMHESTISRVTTRKYMHTPRGIYELKYFFSSHVGTALGGEASSTAIRAVIKKMISAENTNKPLSDSKIASLLSSQGINVARRTVAKYREAMAIPPSNERKRLA
ncbi:MAG: RNA polymerase factor sigma-54 [Gammaproteobacteria bacterium]|nr:RNA polymerase factor sigma-54 [Gammaproteobacteria bacterium]